MYSQLARTCRLRTSIRPSSLIGSYALSRNGLCGLDYRRKQLMQFLFRLTHPRLAFLITLNTVKMANTLTKTRPMCNGMATYANTTTMMMTTMITWTTSIIAIITITVTMITKKMMMEILATTPALSSCVARSGIEIIPGHLGTLVIRGTATHQS